jgi:hypothetical protein
LALLVERQRSNVEARRRHRRDGSGDLDALHRPTEATITEPLPRGDPIAVLRRLVIKHRQGEDDQHATIIGPPADLRGEPGEAFGPPARVAAVPFLEPAT